MPATNRILIDIRNKSAKTMISNRLKKLKTTEEIEDCGEYWFGGCTDWHKIILVTTRTEEDIDNWLYKLRLPPIKHGWDYGICSVNEINEAI